MKKALSSILALAMLLCALTGIVPVHGESAPLRGDANCDGRVDAADAAAILRHLVRLEQLCPLGIYLSTMTTLGEVTAADAALILRWLVRLEEELPMYTPRLKKPETLSKEMILKIQEDFFEWYWYKSGMHITPDLTGLSPEGIWITGYYGSYNGNMALAIEYGIGPGDGYKTKVADCWFYFASSTTHIYIQNDSAFVRLSIAYESGVVTQQDVRDIQHYYYNDPKLPPGDDWRN